MKYAVGEWTKISMGNIFRAERSRASVYVIYHAILFFI